MSNKRHLLEFAKTRGTFARPKPLYSGGHQRQIKVASVQSARAKQRLAQLNTRTATLSRSLIRGQKSDRGA
jgi:hypothetical protein